MRQSVRAFAFLAPVLAATAVVSPSVSAQTVRGVVAAGNVPVPGVVVQLVDSASAVVARVLSNDRGEFRITAATGGSYRLRTLRIGYAPSLSPVLVLRPGAEVSVADDTRRRRGRQPGECADHPGVLSVARRVRNVQER